MLDTPFIISVPDLCFIYMSKILISVFEINLNKYIDQRLIGHKFMYPLKTACCPSTRYA